MIIFLILGALLGILSLVFVLQNITPVTVTFLSMQLEGSLAFVLFLAFGSGILMTLLFLLPSFIRDEFRFSRLRKKARALEEEQIRLREETMAPVQPVPSAAPVSVVPPSL
ncbi:MAG: LapA family protein [Minisyncoccia bacterium]